MAGVMKPYIVRQGDYLAKLAFVHGFDADTVWQDPKNEDIRNLRPVPNILAPGDIIYLPDKAEEPLPIEKGTENHYAAEVPKVDTRLELIDESGALANEEYVVEGLGDPVTGKTDGSGGLVISAPVITQTVQVTLPARNISLHFVLGAMDPVMTTTGLQERLAHLGYLDTFLDGKLDEATSLALRAFQSTQGLSVTGQIDETTAAALKDAFGC